jgi:RNA processing factor Prp31
MRKVILTLVLGALLALPVIAQRGRGMMAGMMGGPDALLMNKSVQEELKFTDKQKSALTELTKKAEDEYGEKMREAFQDKDFEKAGELRKKMGEDLTKGIAKFKDTLTSQQAKRYFQIRVQVASTQGNPRIFTDKEVQKALKLTDKQNATVKEAISDLDKDIKELMDDAGKDFQKRFAAMKKQATMQKEYYSKVVKALTDDQRASWKELGGEKFELRMEGFGGGGGKGKGKGKGGKDKKKSDDF